MKKVKKLLALVTVTALTLSSATVVFADDVKKETVVVYDGREVTAEKKESTSVPATKEKSVEVVAEYKDLAYTSKYLYNSKNADVGSYPVITGADKLNDKIAMDLLKIMQGESTAENYPAYQAEDGKDSIVQFNQEHDFNVSFEAPENFDRYAKVTVSIKYYPSGGKLSPEVINLVYYVDKEGLVEISKVDFDAALEALEVEEEKEVIDVEEELIIVPLRVLAKAIDVKIGWNDETKGVVLTKGDLEIEFQNDVNKYIVNGEEVELEVAPTIILEVMYVPSSLFTKVLGYDLSINDDGNFVLLEQNVEDAKEIIVKIIVVEEVVAE